MIILSPVGAYYESGLDPVKIWIEDEYVRAVKGGIGEAKTGGNYVASLASQVKAHDEGYSQVGTDIQRSSWFCRNPVSIYRYYSLKPFHKHVLWKLWNTKSSVASVGTFDILIWAEQKNLSEGKTRAGQSIGIWNYFYRPYV